jgi:hypothetical protein
VHRFLEVHGFHQIIPNDDGIKNGKNILESKQYQDILESMKSPYELYLQYVQIPVVKDESETGVCVNILLKGAIYYVQTLQDEQIEGHWKIHIDFDFNCDARTLETAYSFVLSKIQDFGIVKAKFAAPYPNINSMKGKEFTLYLREQPITKQKLQLFVYEIEQELIRLDMAPNKTRDFANKTFLKSRYLSYRNARSRVLEIDFPGCSGALNDAFKIAVTSAASACNYLQGYAIVVLEDDLFFIRDGVLLMKDDEHFLRVSRQDPNWDIPTMDGDYFPAEAAEQLAGLLGSEPHNPFNYQDKRFDLMLIDAALNVRKRAVTELSDRTAGEGATREERHVP